MKLTRAERRLAAVIITAAAAMLLCFTLRSAKTAALSPLPYDPPAAETGAVQTGRVNVNAAGLEELMTLPGIGQTRAQAILDDREANGPFRYPEDLIRVQGIGEGVLSGILDQITTGEQKNGPERGRHISDGTAAGSYGRRTNNAQNIGG